MVDVMINTGPRRPFEARVRALFGLRRPRLAGPAAGTVRAPRPTPTDRIATLASWHPPRPDAWALHDRGTPVELARTHLERTWCPDADRWVVIQDLMGTFGCSRFEAEVLVAEQDAVDRARRSGLDDEPVRVQAERLLRGL